MDPCACVCLSVYVCACLHLCVCARVFSAWGYLIPLLCNILDTRASLANIYSSTETSILSLDDGKYHIFFCCTWKRSGRIFFSCLCVCVCMWLCVCVRSCECPCVSQESVSDVLHQKLCCFCCCCYETHKNVKMNWFFFSRADSGKNQ